ncbi:MAG: GtrA family protein [Deltaproteobacteria bacterium]|nr:GtrA family protein [Deltaproteobacteria bacterium]
MSNGVQTVVIRQLLVSRTDRVSIQLLRYTLVGGLAFIVDFLSLFVLTDFAGVHYLFSAAIAFVLGVLTNYLLSILWVFQTRTVKNLWMEVVIFTLIGIIGLGFNELLIWGFTEKAHFHYLASKAVATVFVFSWNFIARKLALFR